ncbi:unnamed protein product [Closterium sp. Naga37s-1]|nr:unnamed protein product [Closterium sp. Naga37s-1]
MASRKAAELNHPASDSLAFALDSNGQTSLESAAAPPYYSPAGSEGFPASLLSPGFGGSNDDDEESLLNRLGFSASPPSPPYPGTAAYAAADAAGGADADGLGRVTGAAEGGVGGGRERGAAGPGAGNREGYAGGGAGLGGGGTSAEASGGASVLGDAGAWAGVGGVGGGGASFAGLQRAGMLSREQLMAFFRAFTALLDSKGIRHAPSPPTLSPSPLPPLHPISPHLTLPLLLFFRAFTALLDSKEARAQIKSSVQEGKSASSVTRLLKEQVLLDMGIEPQFGMTCLRAVPLDYREDRDMVLRICHMHAREEAACDEAELTPLALAQKKMQMQLMQQHQLTVLQHVRTLPVDEQRAFLQSVQGSVQHAQEQRAQGKEKPLVQRDVWETLLQQWQRQFNQTC